MSDYIEPTQTEFSNSEQVAIDILGTTYPKLMTKPGSVLRELLIRPFAYVHSWLTANFNKTFTDTTMVNLKASNATVNPTADAIASNYFVSRMTGLKSKGSITLILRTSTVQLAANSGFTVDGVKLVTALKIIGMGTRYEIIDGIQYVPVIPYDTSAGTYMATIPVEAQESGALELAAGGEAIMDFADSTILSGVLTSPVSGGKDIETDAELMLRAEYNTAAAGIGSYYGIKKKLISAPVNIISMNLVAGEDVPLFRSRFNTVGINPGGYVDCHIKTYTQYATDTIIVNQTYDTATNVHTVVIHDNLHAGLFAVNAVRANGEAILNYTVTFGSADNSIDARGARLSANQTTIITFSTLASVTELTVGIDVSYMPGIFDVQTYMDTSSNQFIGQSLMIKAAVPITATVACKLAYNGTPDTDILDGIKTCMANYVNNMPVGDTALNFSDLQKMVRVSYPDADIRLPCSMSGSMVLKNGTTTGMFSTSGILDVSYPVTESEWAPAVCYFSLITNNIRLELI